jgi:hypothetical protein
MLDTHKIQLFNHAARCRITPCKKVALAKKGSKNQIWGCFIALWGECERWPNIPGDNRWIAENYETRKQIAHGISPVDIETVTSVMNRLDVIQRVAHRFLWDWREEILHAG